MPRTPRNVTRLHPDGGGAAVMIRTRIEIGLEMEWPPMHSWRDFAGLRAAVAAQRSLTD